MSNENINESFASTKNENSHVYSLIRTLLTWFIIFNFIYKMENIVRLLFATLTTYIIVRKAYRRRTLSRSGCFAAAFVGFFVTYSNLCHFASLLTFFYVSNRATKYKQFEKKKFEAEFKENGQRDAAQVLSNGFFATFFSVLYLLDCGYGETPIDFLHDYKASRYSLAVLGSLCCSCGDVLSSELGNALNKSVSNTVFHVTKWKRVPKGANGGVTLIGCLASALGGFLVGLAYYATLKFCLFYQEFGSSNKAKLVSVQWPILVIGTASGFFGSLIDSILGGFYQYSGINRKTGLISNKPSEFDEHISGIDLLTNNQVNLFSCFIMSLLTPWFSFKYYRQMEALF